MKIRLFQVDSFANEIFKGNPAGVCVLDEDISDDMKQNIASEMNCSETSFVRKINNEYRIRYFTPVQEVQLCGHATLAAAHILWEEEIENRDDKILFKANKEEIVVSNCEAWIKMGFPKDTLEECELPIDKEKALGFSHGIKKIMKSKIGWYLIEVENENIVLQVKPDFNELLLSKTIVIVTCQSVNSDYDFASRFFAPHVGINEDPVTGYAHTSLGEYWSNKLGKNDLIGYQLSRRKGFVRVQVENTRNQILGKARTVFEIKIAGSPSMA
jgi:PhzF family phenazine biosynthesis protein